MCINNIKFIIKTRYITQPETTVHKRPHTWRSQLHLNATYTVQVAWKTKAIMFDCPNHFTFINCLIQSGATWWKTICFPLFVKPSCFLILVQILWKISYTKNILLFKDMFDMSTVLLQNAFEMSSFTDASCLRDFLPWSLPHVLTIWWTLAHYWLRSFH